MDQLNETLAKAFLRKINSKEELANWVMSYLDFYFPDSHVDPASNSDPIDWMWEVYNMYKENRGHESPSVIVVSSRESYKTLTESVLAVLLMAHFQITIAHMAAIVPQATAASNYVKKFLARVMPYLAFHGWSMESQNDKEVTIKTPDGNIAGLKIIVCTVAGANSSHVSYMSYDEVDTVRSKEGIRAYQEAQFIPGVFNGQNPISVKTSTLKFPGGLFAKEKRKAEEKGWKIFQWNIIDITERCLPSRHKPELPKEVVYVSTKLPLSTINENSYHMLTDQERARYDKIEAMAGCAKCPLLPVCRGRLASRKPTDYGGLWKPLDFTIAQFDKVDPDLAEAQLMCWKPSSQGMVYPRFQDQPDGTGNVLSLNQAYENFTGNRPTRNIAFDELKQTLIRAGVSFYCGLDWGHSHAFAVSVFAIIPGMGPWLVDAYSVSGLEFDDMMALGARIRDMYKPKKWFADTAQPMFCKAFTKAKMPCAKFTKDVDGGIAAIRGQVMNAKGQRALKIVRHERTEVAISGFKEHCFKLDSIGNLTSDPDDGPVADIMDSIRYFGQNMYSVKGKAIVPTESAYPTHSPVNPSQPFGDTWLSQKIRNLAESTPHAKGSTGGVIWDMSDPAEPLDE